MRLLIPKILDLIHVAYHLKRIELYLKKNFPSDINTVFDVGCYTGIFLDVCLKVYSSTTQIFAFEAEKEIFNKLEKYHNIKNVKIYNIGIGDTNTVANLNVSYQKGTSTFSQINQHSKYLKFKTRLLKERVFVSQEQVQMQTIDMFAVSNDITQIDLLKIDTEGYELAVLKGAVQSILNTKIILIELSSHDMYFNYDKKEIEQFLLQNNFLLVKTFRTPFQKWEDRIYVNSTKLSG